MSLRCQFKLLERKSLMDNNFKDVRRILWLILLINIIVAVTKIIIGTMIKSTSMTADGLHSLSDSSSNIVGLIGVWFASKPIDKCHPYGHRKFETLAGLFISIMLFGIGIKIVIDGFMRIINPVVPDVTFESLVILLITLLINIFISTVEYSKGKKLNSQILISDSMHTRSDIYMSAGVLFTILGIRMGIPPIIDPIASFIVAGLIFHGAYEIFKYNRDVLVDRAVVDPEKIRDIVLSFHQVKGIHKIRSRGSINDLHIDMHILTEPNLSVEESHKLIHSIEDSIRKNLNINVQLIAHIEPFYENKRQRSSLAKY